MCWCGVSVAGCVLWAAGVGAGVWFCGGLVGGGVAVSGVGCWAALGCGVGLVAEGAVCWRAVWFLCGGFVCGAVSVGVVCGLAGWFVAVGVGGVGGGAAAAVGGVAAAAVLSWLFVFVCVCPSAVVGGFFCVQEISRPSEKKRANEKKESETEKRREKKFGVVVIFGG